MDTTAVCSKRKGAGGETDVAVGVVRVVEGGDEEGGLGGSRGFSMESAATGLP